MIGFDGTRAFALDEPGINRRSADRQKLILRVGLLEQDGRQIFCLVRNISPAGVQVKPYSRVIESDAISLQVGDENPIPGTAVWDRNGLVGIRFKQSLNPQALLRIGQKMMAQRRRNAPRVTTDLKGCLRTGGLKYSTTVCDLSMVGARLRMDERVAFGETAQLEVSGLPSMDAHVRWSDGAEHGVSFPTPLPMQVLSDLLSIY